MFNRGLAKISRSSCPTYINIPRYIQIKKLGNVSVRLKKKHSRFYLIRFVEVTQSANTRSNTIVENHFVFREHQSDIVIIRCRIKLLMSCNFCDSECSGEARFVRTRNVVFTDNQSECLYAPSVETVSGCQSNRARV